MYKIKQIVKPEYIEYFRRIFGYIPYEGMIITDEQKKDFYKFEQKMSNTIFVNIEKLNRL